MAKSNDNDAVITVNNTAIADMTDNEYFMLVKRLVFRLDKKQLLVLWKVISDVVKE